MADKQSYYRAVSAVTMNGTPFAPGVYVASVDARITPGDLVSAMKMGHVALDADAVEPGLGLHSGSDQLKQLVDENERLSKQVANLTQRLKPTKGKK